MNTKYQVDLIVTRPKESKLDYLFFIIPLFIGYGISILPIFKEYKTLITVAPPFGIILSVISFLAYAIAIRRPDKLTKNKLQITIDTLTIVYNDSPLKYDINELADINIILSNYDYGPFITIFDLANAGKKGTGNKIFFRGKDIDYRIDFYLPDQTTAIRLINILNQWKMNQIQFNLTDLNIITN